MHPYAKPERASKLCARSIDISSIYGLKAAKPSPYCLNMGVLPWAGRVPTLSIPAGAMPANAAVRIEKRRTEAEAIPVIPGFA